MIVLMEVSNKTITKLIIYESLHKYCTILLSRLFLEYSLNHNSAFSLFLRANFKDQEVPLKLISWYMTLGRKWKEKRLEERVINGRKVVKKKSGKKEKLMLKVEMRPRHWHNLTFSLMTWGPEYENYWSISIAIW